MLYHIAALLKFSQEDWKGTIQLQNKSSNALRRTRKLNYWCNYLIKAICLYELGSFGEARRLLSSIRDSGSEFETNYPKVLIQLVESLMNDQKDNVRALMMAKEQIESLLTDENEKFEAHYFNALSWIESKLENVELPKILAKGTSPKLMSISRAS